VAVVRAAGADLAAMRRGGSDGGGRGGGGSSGGAPRCTHRWGVTPSSATPSAAAAAAPRFVAAATNPTHTPNDTSTPLFDATAAAAALLPLPQRFARSGAIAGMPLQLRNCSVSTDVSTGRGVAAAGAESGAEGGEEARGGGVAQELLAPWQARGDISRLDLPRSPYISPRPPLDLA